MPKAPVRLENPYSSGGRWYRAAFHMHSTNSDGTLSPAATVSRYVRKGFRIICLSDHDFVSRFPKGSFPGRLLLPAAEISWPHLVHIGARGRGKLPPVSLARALARIARQGGFSVLCHPRWSNMTWSQHRRAWPVDAVEIWNYLCETENATGYALGEWDMLLQSGRRLWGVAADDAHFHRNLTMYAGGWVMVRASRLTPAAVLKALKRGSFYSSQGPGFEDIRIRRGEIEIRCTGAVELRAIADGVGSGRAVRAPRPKKRWLLSYGEWNTQPRRYLRLEIRDRRGRLAWTNPFFVR